MWKYLKATLYVAEEATSMKQQLPWCLKQAAGVVLSVGLWWAAGSLLVTVPSVPWGHSHQQKQFRGQGIVGRVHGPFPSPQVSGFPQVGRLQPPQTRVLSAVSTSSTALSSPRGVGSPLFSSLWLLSNISSCKCTYSWLDSILGENVHVHDLIVSWGNSMTWQYSGGK